MELSSSSVREQLQSSLVQSEDCIEYFQSAYRLLKESNRAYSYHMLAREGGIPSVAYFREVLQGQRAMTPKAFSSITKAFKLNKNAIELLRLMLAKKDDAFNPLGLRAEEIDQAIQNLKKLILRESSKLTVTELDPIEDIPCLDVSKVVAALGTEERGATLLTICHKTKLISEYVEDILEHLVMRDIVVFNEPENSYILPSGKLIYSSSFEQSFIKTLYVESMAYHQKCAQEMFKDYETTRMVFTVSTRREKMLQAKEKIRKIIEELADEVEDPEGDKVYNLVFGLAPV